MKIIKSSNFLDWNDDLKPAGLNIYSVSKSQSVMIKADISDLNEIQNNVSSGNINSGDKILILKQSKFPSLFLSKIEGIDIKRTIKIDNADKVIIDFPFEKIRCYHSECRTYVKVKNKDDVREFLCGFEPTKEDIKNYFGNDFKISKIEDAYILNKPKEYVDTIINYSNKMVDTNTLNEYINKFLPEIDKESLENISQLLQSKESSTVKIGIELLHTFNLSKMYLEVVKVVWEAFNNICYYGQQNIAAFQHIESKLKLDKRILSQYTFENFVRLVYNNLSDLEKEIVRSQMCEYFSNEIRERFGYLLEMYDLTFNIEK